MFRRFFEGDWEGRGWLRVEELREGDTMVIRAELPGIDPDKDVELTVANGVLQIRAERQEKSEDTGKSGYRSEFRYGSFVRNLALPDGVKPEDVTAAYRDGILEVRVPLPKAAKQQAKKIEVNRG
jgi:HSP20 family protein